MEEVKPTTPVCDFCSNPARYYTTQEASAYCESDECEAKALEIESRMLDEHDRARQEEYGIDM